ncbi:MAG: hypothetical protein U9O96_04410 [Candidatus Thermoplasmatota archaeon]|nr:hypothetical protein [Candidatus Thermoplasmatota archaeon]
MKENWSKKDRRCASILLVGIIVLVGSIPLYFSYTDSTMVQQNDGGILDQQQTQRDGGLACLFEDEFAQGFVPTKDMLTRVELLINRSDPVIPGLEIAIRDAYDGGNLVSVGLDRDFPPDSYTWIEFDFEDIHVTPGETYYIVWDGWHGGTLDNAYYWGFGSGDPYPEGQSYHYDDIHEYWRIIDDPEGDFCFKTYGRENLPPDTPEKPSGENYLQPGVTYNYYTRTYDPDGNKVRYCFDWDDSTPEEWTSLECSGKQISLSHIFFPPGNHYVRVKAADEYGKESNWSESYTVLVVDKPPETPTISGPANGKAGVAYTYNLTSADLNKDQVRFHIKWGDGTEEVTGYYDSGERANISHVWNEQGTYTISVRAENSLNSSWAQLQVSMPKSFSVNIWTLLERLDGWFVSTFGRERFPGIFGHIQ